MTSGLEWSRGKPRPKSPRIAGHDASVVPLPSDNSAAEPPDNDAASGRFVKGNRAHRRRAIKAQRRGIATLNPASVPEWMRPHVIDGAAYGMALRGRFQDPALAALVGDVADAHAIYRALLVLGVQGDADALRESRAWLREHRSALATLTALAAEGGAPPSDDHLYVKEPDK